MQTSDPSTNVIPCLFSALRDIERVVKSKTAEVQTKSGGKAYEYSYATLSDTLAEVKRACADHKLVLMQNAFTGNDGLLYLSTMLLHDSGEWVSWPPVGMRLPSDPQAVGSTLTYLRRYTLTTIFALPVEDDDGRDATQQARHAADHDGARTNAEAKIRKLLGEMNADRRSELVRDFRARFGCGLSDLPAAQHGDALTWVIEATTAKAGPPVAPYDPDDPMGVGPGMHSAPTPYEQHAEEASRV